MFFVVINLLLIGLSTIRANIQPGFLASFALIGDRSVCPARRVTRRLVPIVVLSATLRSGGVR
jgi:hypothetical protein